MKRDQVNLIGAFLLWLSCLAVSASGASLQALVDGSRPGEPIELGPGVFAGSVVIDHSVTLRGTGEETIIEGDRPGPTILVRGTDIAVRLEHLTVRGGRGWNGHGIEAQGSPAIDLVEVAVRGNEWAGVWVTDRTILSLRDCRIVENGTHGLYTWDFARIDARECEISRNETFGILGFHVSEIALVACDVRDNLCAVEVWDGTRVRAKESSFCGSSMSGLAAQNGAFLELIACTISANRQQGLLLSDSGRAIALACDISSNGSDGVFLEKDGIGEFVNCRVWGNGGFGIRAATATCMGFFDPRAPYKGWVEGGGNHIPAPGEPDENQGGRLCPIYPGSIWPPGFLARP